MFILFYIFAENPSVVDDFHDLMNQIINNSDVKLKKIEIMPRGDRTGPIGQGPVTGRGLGYCRGYDSPGFAKGFGGGMGRGMGFGRGAGFGRGMGWGRGAGYGFHSGAFSPGFVPGYPMTPSISREDEIKLLKNQADALSRSQKDIEKRLGELEKEE